MRGISLSNFSHKKKLNKKAFSSIVGAIFMILIVWSLASSYFVFTMNENNSYNNAVKAKTELDINRLSESINVVEVTYSVNADNQVTVTPKIQNTGAISVQFLTIWAYANNYTWANYNFKNLTATIKGGETLSLSPIEIPITGINLEGNYDVSAWLITTRGNTIPLPEQPAMTNNVVIAEVSNGIGSVGFDFEQFWHYEFSATPQPGTELTTISPQNYTISESKYNVFHVVVTDWDIYEKTILLDGNSSIFILGEHSGTVKWAKWSLVNVTNNKIYPFSGVRYSLEYGVPTDLYFAGSISSIDTGSTYPLNILLFGKKGNNDYGQNIPFVSIYLVN